MKAELDYYKKTFSEIVKGTAMPVYLLKGEEHFVMEELVSRLIDRLVSADMRSFNLSVDHASEIDIKSFLSTARSFPFLSDRRVMVVRELERMRGKWKQLISYCEDPVESTTVIFLFSTHDDKGRRIRPPKDFSTVEKTVRKCGRVIQFDRLNDAGLKKWVQARAKKLGFEFDSSAVARLTASVGTDLYDLSNEIDKLGISFEGGKAGSSDVASVIGSYRMRGVYDMIDCIGRKDAVAALEILSGIINSGAERPSVVVYQLTRRFLAMLRIKAGQGGSGYRYDKLKSEAAGLKTRDILVWLENLRRTEILMKSTTFPEELLLDCAILHSIRGGLVERAV